MGLWTADKYHVGTSAAGWRTYRQLESRQAVTVVFHVESADAVRQGAISICMQNFPDIRWQWGTWQY
jgi:hypothetical protein